MSVLKYSTQTISKKDNLHAAYYGKSIAYEALGDIDEAIKDLSVATSLTPDDLGYRFELGRLYFNRGVSVSSGLEQEEAAVKEIIESDEETQEGEEAEEELSVKPRQVIEGIIEVNNDLRAAEQLFLSVLLVNQKHANARYSLALLYQKVGDNEKARIMANSLINILENEQQKQIIKQQFADVL